MIDLFTLNLLIKGENTVNEPFRPRWTTSYIDIDRYDLINPRDDCIVIENAPT
jgi:hypothetical protein